MKALEVERLTKVYPKFTLDNVSFSVEEGRIAGLIGRNGRIPLLFRKAAVLRQSSRIPFLSPLGRRSLSQIPCRICVG